MRIDIKQLLLLSIILISSARGETYWIATNGLASGDGSPSRPFGSIETALSRHGGGHTYIFKPGIYTGQIALMPIHSGTPQNPTVLKSAQKYKAILHGSMGHGLYVPQGSQWVIIDGFEVRCAAIDGVKSNADYTVIRNCWIHHNCENGIGSYGVKESVYERNLVEFNGTHIQFTHGLYVFGKKLTVRQNVVRFNASHGLSLCPDLSESLVENNLIYGNTRSGIIIYALKGGSNNRILHNTIVENGYGIYIKDGMGDVIANNIIAGNTRWKHWVTNPAIELVNTEPNKVKIENNLIYPKTSLPYDKNIFDEPQFIYPAKGVFFLKSTSPAIGKGALKHAASKDFWGRSRPPNTPPDLGCFPYDQKILQDSYNKEWYYGWPFFFKEGTGPMPDLWADPNK